MSIKSEESDCEIKEKDTSIISIPDSVSEGKASPLTVTETDGEGIDYADDAEKTNLESRESLPPKDTNLDTTNDFLFEIRFRNNDEFCRLSEKLLGHLQAMAQEDKLVFIEHNNDDGATVSLRAFKIASDDGIEIVSTVNKQKTPEPAELFVIDTAPAVKLNTVIVPSYKRTVKEVLDDGVTQSKKRKTDDDCRRPRHVNACFNCGVSDHNLRDCPKQKNMKRINRAKKALMMKSERYHMDVEQRFAHLRPGHISKTLRNALDLRRDELPFFFYRMRVLGYPPGWLEEAKVEHSGISLVNSEDRESESSRAEAESEANIKYDVLKFVEFPGFNKDPGEDFYDDYSHHNVPPMNRYQMKDEFIKSFGNNIINGYKRKKLKVNDSEGDSNSANAEAVDMDIDDDDDEEDNRNVIFSRPPPPSTAPNDDDELPPLPPESPDSSEDGEITDDDEDDGTPSLASLREKQRKLLEQLNTSNLSDTSGVSTSNIIEQTNPPTTEGDREESISQPIHGDVDIQESADSPQSPDRWAHGGRELLKESYIGTPILKFSPYENLPAGDNFKVGVSDVINFENLPDSTGKYEQMKVVIKKVRKVVSKLNNE